MSNKAPQISLPQGGGAIRGLGESFQPDLHTGTGNFSVPLEIPAGRNGFQPTLTLSYSTGNPNGPFGMGWALSVPGVRRKTSRGLPRYDHSDVFVLSGSEDLVPVPGAAPGRQRYRPRIEGLYARIEHVTSDGQDYWDVASRDGLRSRYGTPRPPGAAAGWRDPAAVSDPAAPGRMFGWLLSQTTDTCGNLIRYRYDRDPTAAAEGFDQLYLADISYVDYGDPADPAFLVRIAFSYETRPDPFSDRRPGFEIRTTRRCTRVDTWMQHQAPAVLARVVNLDYATAGGNGRSLLRQLRIAGHDGDATQQLPPLEFDYTAFTPQQRRYQNVTAAGGEMPATSLTRPDTELVDLFGNGLPCVLQMNGQVRYWRNLGQATLDRPRSMTPAPPVALAESGVQLADMNGDGRPDLLITQAPLTGYYPLTFTGAFDPSGFVPYAQAPTVNLEDPHVKLVDLTGDGVIDALRTASSYELYYNDPAGGWAEARLLTPGQRGVPDADLADPAVKLADMTGDGLSDIVLIHDRNISYWPHLGYGKWDTPITMAQSPHFDDSAVYGTTGYDPRRILVGDIDGDGCSDVVYVGDGHLTVWLNQSGRSFADPVVIRGTPPVSDIDAVRLTDLLGTGTAGILWTYDAGTQRGGGYKFLDLTGGTKSYLLNAVDNHRGARTTVDYAPSTRDYLDDQQAGRPWRATLPFPVQVVASTTVTDEFSGTTLTTEYHYHHGHWDGVEREFRGFGRVDHFDTLANGSGQHWSPPTETRTWFHPGPVGPEHGAWTELDLTSEYWPSDPSRLGPTTTDLPGGLPRRAQRDAVRALSGQVLRSELYAYDGDPALENRPYTVTEHRYQLAAVSDGRPDPDFAAAPVIVPRPIAERTTQWERGNDPMHHYTFTEAYDAYGRPRYHGEVGVPRDQNPDTVTAAGTAERYLITLTATDCATRDDADRYLLDRVTATTGYEILDDGTMSLPQLWGAAVAGTAASQLLSHTLTYYDGDPFTGLPLGELGDRGLASRAEQLVHTDDSLAAVVTNGTGGTGQLPPYLAVPARPWTAEYPPDFTAALPLAAGYTHHAGQPGYYDGWYAITARQQHDPRGLVLVFRDALAHDTTVDYDPFGLLPVRIADPAGLEHAAAYDYRISQPALATDINGNRIAYTYTPLGLLATIAVMGKPDEETGDTPDQPGTRYEYGLTAFDDSPPGGRQPAWIHTATRVEHRWEIVHAEKDRRRQLGLPPPTGADIAALFPPGETDQFPQRFLRVQELSDGFGRSLQTRAQSDDRIIADLGLPADMNIAAADVISHTTPPGAVPQVVVTGWQVYDNKGRVVEKYEPYFDTGWNYLQPSDQRLAHELRKVITTYDPRGHPVRTTHPDGSQELVVYGIPAILTDPFAYQATPWESYAYDANDNAGRTHPAEGAAWTSHWNTPHSTLVDALGRITEATERTEGGRALVTHTRYDIDGNVLEIIDTLGRIVSRSAFDLIKRAWRTALLDAGTVQKVLDPLDGVVEERDAKGALTVGAYDQLHRATHTWARDHDAQPATLRQATIYGDASPNLTREQAATLNLLGRPHVVCDEAGQLGTGSYDLHGKPLGTRRQVLRTEILLSGVPATGGDWTDNTYAIDWARPDALALLDSMPYEVNSRYDAVGRRTQVTCPADVDGQRNVLTSTYSRAGHLTSVDLDGQPYVREIIYNARGQRVLTVLGNGVMTRYAYDPDTFRLARLRSDTYRETTPGTWHPTGTIYQDHGYRYDLIGNLLTLIDRTPGCGIPPGNQNAQDRRFTYDPLYRLTLATGRECDVAPPPPPWTDIPRCTDITRARSYTESYTYDDVGGLLRLAHAGGTPAAPGFTRDYTPTPEGNQLATMSTGGTTYSYSYDPCGNLVTETTTRHFEWDHANRLIGFRVQSGQSTAPLSVYVQYRYDSSGQRVLKVRRNQGGELAITIYVGEFFERFINVSIAGLETRHDTLSIVTARDRVALKRIGAPVPGDRAPATLYELADHLGSITTVLDEFSATVSREEYSPYGETSFGGYTKKRFRYTGKERDEETGFYYHGARYYAPWFGRWTSPDPAGHIDGSNLYVYALSNPTRFRDPSGSKTEPDVNQCFVETNQPPGSSASPESRPSGSEANSEGSPSRREEMELRSIPELHEKIAEERSQASLPSARLPSDAPSLSAEAGPKSSSKEEKFIPQSPVGPLSWILKILLPFLGISVATRGLDVGKALRVLVLGMRLARVSPESLPPRPPPGEVVEKTQTRQRKSGISSGGPDPEPEITPLEKSKGEAESRMYGDPIVKRQQSIPFLPLVVNPVLPMFQGVPTFSPVFVF